MVVMQAAHCPHCTHELIGAHVKCPCCGSLLDLHRDQVLRAYRWALAGMGLLFIGLGAYLYSSLEFSKTLREIVSLMSIYIGFCALTATSLGSLRTMLWAHVALSAYALNHGGSAVFALGIVGMVLSMTTLWLSAKVRDD